MVIPHNQIVFTMNTIFTHRSIRKFKQEPVSEEVLTSILEAGTRASNTGNMQVYSIVVTKDEKLRHLLWEAHFKQNMVLQAPVILTFCADINRFEKWCQMRNARPGYDNFLWFVNASVDAVLASQNCSLMAEEHGLGICYLGTAVYMAEKIIDILKLPKGVVPVTAIAMGYPDENPPLTDRLPLSAIVHYETYGNYSDRQIDQLYYDKENLEQNKALVKLNQTENLAQIFTLKRYKQQDNRLFSKLYLNVLHKQGFMNNDE